MTLSRLLVHDKFRKPLNVMTSILRKSTLKWQQAKIFHDFIFLPRELLLVNVDFHSNMILLQNVTLFFSQHLHFVVVQRRETSEFYKFNPAFEKSA
jgi:hypothetical protein